MKAATKHTSPVIIPIKGKDIQKNYALTAAEAKKVVTKLSALHAKRGAAGKVTRVKGRFSPGFFLPYSFPSFTWERTC